MNAAPTALPTPQQRTAIDLWHATFHAGSSAECSPEGTSPCFLVQVIAERDAIEQRARRFADRIAKTAEEQNNARVTVEQVRGLVDTEKHTVAGRLGLADKLRELLDKDA